MDIVIPEGKVCVGGYCPKCGNDGYYFADTVEECHFVQCAQCGQQVLETWCSDCGIGFTKKLRGKSHSSQWKCDKCKKKYTLTEDFYIQPVLLYREKDIPKHLRNKKPLLLKMWQGMWTVLKPTTIRVKITLVISFILWGAIALVWKKPFDMYHQVLLRDLFFAAVISVVLALPAGAASGWEWDLNKRFDRWTSRIVRFLWAVIMAAVIYLGSTIGYDWFASPCYIIGTVTSVTGNLSYTTKTRQAHNWLFSIKLDNGSRLWHVDSPLNREDFYRSLQGKKVMIEYSPAGKKVVSVKSVDVGER